MSSRNLVWTGAAGDGNFDNAANWEDTGTGQPALTPPTASDFVSFTSTSGGTIGGIGSAETLGVNGTGTWILDGSITLYGQPSATALPFSFYVSTNLTLNGATLDAAGGTDAIGGTTTATVTAEGGSGVQALGTNIGTTDGPSGSLVLTGQGTTWHDVSNPALNQNGYVSGFTTVGGEASGVSGFLSISDGAALTSDTGGYVGVSGGTGTVTVASGGTWSAGTNLTIGQSGTGSLTVNAGGVVSSSDIINVGENVGSNGTLTINDGGVVNDTAASQSANYLMQIGYEGNGTVSVNGSGALLDTNTNPLSVGFSSGANGSLMVSSGGVVDVGSANSNTGNVALSVGHAGTGLVTVSGSGSTMTANGYVYIGRAGTGELTVENGGTFTVSLDQSNTGGISVGDGNPSANSGIGGSGTLTIASGGVMNVAQNITVGGNGVDGLMSVTGAQVNIGTDLGVGAASLISGATYGGTGNVTIGQGGTVKITGAPSTSQLAVAIGGAGTGAALLQGIGSVTVTGTGALLDTNGGPVAVGTGGSASLTISQGGSVAAGTPNSSNTAALSAGRLGAGTLTVTDAGSQLTADGFTYIGGAGTGTLQVENSATMTVGLDPAGLGSLSIGGAGNSSSTTVRIGGNGTALVTTSGLLDSKQNVNVGTNGVTGTLTVENGGTVDLADQLLIGNTLTVAAGTTIVTETGTTVAASPTVLTGNGTVNVDAGGTLKSDGPNTNGSATVVVGNGVLSTGTLNVSGAGALLNSGGDRITVGGEGQGTMTINQGGTALAGANYTDSEPAAVLGYGSTGNGDLTVSDSGSEFSAAGLFDVGLSGTGQLTVENGGTVTAQSFDAGVNAGATGIVNVVGTSSLLDVSGQVTFGDQAAGTLVVTGGGLVTAATADFGLNAGGGGILELEGTGSRLTVTSNLTFGGTGSGQATIGVGSELSVGGNISVGAGYAVSGTGGAIDPVNYVNAGQTIGQLTITASGSIDNTGFIVAQSGLMELNGTVTGTGALQLDAVGTLQLDSAVSGSTVVFNAPGATLIGKDIGAFDPGPITGFQAGDLIAFPDAVPITGKSYNPANGQLTLTDGLGQALVTLTFQGSYTQDEFTLNNNELGLVCFLPGTLIATPDGEVPVERLSPGDLVLTTSGAARPIVWIGTGAALATRGRRNAATPVIVRKGALGPNLPHHDLRVTKGHSFLIDGVLIPAEFLVNHRSIEWDDRAQEVTVFHIELETHDVLLANGAPAESYRDDGNRWLFRNASPSWHLPPMAPCAPVLTGGPAVDAIWRRLLDRAGPRPMPPLTEDPDLHLLAEGRRVDPARRAGEAYVFALPAVPAELRIISRAASPAELGRARDPRCLGVAIRRIEAARGARLRVLTAEDARLLGGFYDFEPNCGFRWTDGEAEIPAGLLEGFDGAVEVTLHVAATATYPDPGEVEAAA